MRWFVFEEGIPMEEFDSEAAAMHHIDAILKSDYGVEEDAFVVVKGTRYKYVPPKGGGSLVETK
jgi:hypothetical protein